MALADFERDVIANLPCAGSDFDISSNFLVRQAAPEFLARYYLVLLL
jgi:hypothetical protein